MVNDAGYDYQRYRPRLVDSFHDAWGGFIATRDAIARACKQGKGCLVGTLARKQFEDYGEPDEQERLHMVFAEIDYLVELGGAHYVRRTGPRRTWLVQID